MKPIICNVLFCTLILPGVPTMLDAQSQSTSVPRPAVRGTLVARSLPVITTVGEGNTYASSDHQINEADLKSKEVSKEIAMPKNGEIYIENISRNIEVKIWDQQKVKVTTTVYFEGESKLTDEEWFEKNNLSLKILGNSVKIKSGGVTGSNFYSFGNGSNAVTIAGGGVAVFNGTGQNIGTKSNLKKTVTITVPANSKLDIESKYADVTLPDNINDLNADISNGNLEAGNLNKFILRSKYSNINVGDIKDAEIELINGRFSARDIDNLDIDSKYSTIEMAAAKKLVLRSTNDEYELEEAGEVRGRKNYGNLRITKLNSSLEVEGANADIKIRNIAASVSLIEINDRYADIRIPLKNTKNYSVDFFGAYSSVYGNFEKKALALNDIEKKSTTTTVGTLSNLTAVSGDKGTEKKPTITSAGSLNNLTVTGVVTPAERVTVSGALISQNWPPAGSNSAAFGRSYSSMGNDTPSKFTATVGDGKGLKIDIKCQNCTVDFK